MSKRGDLNNKHSISKEEIINVSLEIIQRDGLDKLSMRKIADELNIKGASLYWHFKSKNELLEQIADEICKKIEFPSSKLSWDEQIIQLSHNLRKLFLEYRDSAIVLSETAPHTPYRKQLIFQISDIFKTAGFKGEEIFSALWLINTFVSSFVIDEHRLNNIRKNEKRRENDPNQDDHIKLKIPDMDKEFNFGLEVILEGLRKKLRV